MNSCFPIYETYWQYPYVLWTEREQLVIFIFWHSFPVEKNALIISYIITNIPEKTYISFKISSKIAINFLSNCNLRFLKTISFFKVPLIGQDIESEYVTNCHQTMGYSIRFRSVQSDRLPFLHHEFKKPLDTWFQLKDKLLRSES